MKKLKNLYICLLLVTVVSLLVTGCGNRSIPVTSTEKNISGITTDNAAVITEAVVDMFDKPDILSNRISQVLFNQVVKVISNEGAWTNIKLLDGSTGWIKSKYVDRDIKSVTDMFINNKIVVTARVIDIYSGNNNSVKYKKVVLGTELYSFNKTKTGYEIFLPGDKKGWVEDGGVIAMPISESIIPKTSSNDFVQTVKKFEGTIFIIGGISRWGIDSSGLVYISSKINGVDVPRDLQAMSKSGNEVKRNQLQIGDLIFLSTDNLKKDVSDVAVFIGEDQFIHSSTTRGVIIDTLKDSYFENRLCGIRRIF